LFISSSSLWRWIASLILAESRLPEKAALEFSSNNHPEGLFYNILVVYNGKDIDSIFQKQIKGEFEL